MQSFDSIDEVHRVHRTGLSRLEFDRALTGEAVILKIGADGVARLALPQLGAALNILDQCESALVASAGLDPDELKEIARHAKAPPMLRRLDDSYFERSEKEDPEDQAIARYIIDAQGRPASCGLIHRARSEFLNQEACLDWGPLRFDPAVNSSGERVRGLHFRSARWMRRARGTRR